MAGSAGAAGAAAPLSSAICAVIGSNNLAAIRAICCSVLGSPFAPPAGSAGGVAAGGVAAGSAAGGAACGSVPDISVPSYGFGSRFSARL